MGESPLGPAPPLLPRPGGGEPAAPPSPAPPSAEPGYLLSVTSRPGPRPGHVVVEVVGEVDDYTAPVLDACLTSQASRPDVRELVVHLSRVTLLDGMGLSALARAARRCRSRGARLVIRTGGRRAGTRPLETTRLAGLLTVEPAAEPEPPPVL